MIADYYRSLIEPHGNHSGRPSRSEDNYGWATMQRLEWNSNEWPSAHARHQTYYWATTPWRFFLSFLCRSLSCRLNESSEKTSSFQASSPGETKKRKLVEHEESFARGGRQISSSSFTDVVSSSSATDVVKIDETNPAGQFIKLFNTATDKVFNFSLHFYCFL